MAKFVLRAIVDGKVQNQASTMSRIGNSLLEDLASGFWQSFQVTNGLYPHILFQ